MALKPNKLMEQEDAPSYPNAAQFENEFLDALSAWDRVFASFPDDVQLTVEGLLLQAEEADHVHTDALRKLATVFRANAKDQAGQRISNWIQVIADFGDFFGRAVNIIVDSHIGPEDDEDEEPGK